MANDTLHSVLKNHPLLIAKVMRSMMPENASKRGQFKVQHNSSAIFWTFKDAYESYKTMLDCITNHQCLVLAV